MPRNKRRRMESEDQDAVLDEITSEILFPKDAIRNLFFILMPGVNQLEEMIRTPITDLEVINERLNTIGELVKDPDLRERLSNILSVFGRNYEKTLYHEINYFFTLKLIEMSDKGWETQRVIEVIADIAKGVMKLPDSFGRTSYESKTIEALSDLYFKMMSRESDTSVRGFFDYIITLNAKLDLLQESLKKERADGESETSSSMGGTRITYEQLEELLDVDKLQSYKVLISQLYSFYELAAPFVGLAEHAFYNNYCKPEVLPKEENCLVVRRGRYENLRDKAVPNDTLLEQGACVEVKEGVNYGGKTIDIKKDLIIAVMALSGCWVPAEYARVSIRDRIILREKGIGDAIAAFQQDCGNVNEIFPPEGEYWLIGLDETFTSTERKGGEALTYGLIRSVIDQGKSILLISSHYPELSEAFVGDLRVVFSHFPFKREYSEEGDKFNVVFPHKKIQGPLQDFQYAIAVSESRGFDEKVLEYAKERLRQRGIE